MKPVDQKKHDLFLFIYFSEKQIHIKDITDHFLISTTSATRYIHQLNEDFNDILPSNSVQIVCINNVYFFKNETDKSIAYLIDILRLNYFKGTTTFKIFDALLKKNFRSMNELAKYLYMSPPHLYKSIKELNSFLKMFKIKITFQTNELSSNFVSQKEQNIRIFFCVYYWTVFKGLEWPFKKMIPPLTAKLAETHSFSHSQMQHFNYLVVISTYRLYSRKQNVLLDKETLNDLTPYMLINDFSQPLHSEIHKISEHLYNQEKVFFNFLVRFYISDCDNNGQKMAIALEFLDSATPLSQYTKKIVEHLFSTFGVEVSQEAWFVSYYNLNTYFLYIKYISLDYSFWYKQKNSFFNQNSSNSTVEIVRAKFISYYKSTFSEFPPPFKLTEEGIEHISHCLFFLVDSNLQMPVLKICIQYSRFFYLNNQIKRNINSVFQNIVYVDTPENADLIISDCYQGEYQNVDYFYLFDIFDEANWKAMFACIEKIAYKRSFIYSHPMYL